MSAPADRLSTIARYRELLHEAAAKGIEHEVERELCKSDLFYLLVVVCGRSDVNHDWLFARCREIQAEPNGYLDLWSREHYKSTLQTFGKLIQDVLIDPETTIGIFSFNRPMAKQFLRQIMREIAANEKLKQLFPDIFWANPQREAPKWSEDDGIIVKRKSNPKESTIEAWGLVDGQPTSKHFREMVYDDIVTRDSVTNPEMIAKVTDAWATSRALRTDGGVARYVGTRWAHNDTYRTILSRGSAIERRYVATVDGTPEGEPVLKTREWVSEQRRDMGPYVFAAQVMMDPTSDRTHGFLEEWLRYWQPKKEDGLNKYLLVDAASEKGKDNDYTAMAVIGLGADENYYLVDAVRDRLSLKERGDAVFALHRRWKPKAVGYERYGMMADIEYLKLRMAEENYRFEVTEVGGTKVSKFDRIRRMVPIFEAGRFWLPEALIKVDYEGKHVDLTQAFVDEEYKPFPVGLHDDLFDAISRIWDITTVWPKSTKVEEDRYARKKQRPRAHSFMAV